MPVIVIGADTGPGVSIVDRLVQPGREVRAFVSDPDTADELKDRGVKVAVGDVSDESHLSGACLNCFSAVMVEEAAVDGRERAFAGQPSAVLTAWAGAISTAGVHRAIWVCQEPPPPVNVQEVAVADPTRADLAEEVFRLDERAEI